MIAKLLVLIIMLLTSCTKPLTRVLPPVICGLTQEFTLTAQAAQRQLIGNWRIDATTGANNSPVLPVVNLLIEFRADGFCLITPDQQTSKLVAYSVTDGANAPILRIADTLQNTTSTPLGRSTLLVCEQGLALNYGWTPSTYGYGYIGRRVMP